MENGNGIVFIIQLVMLCITGIIASTIARNRGRSPAAWFFGGFFLGIIGIIIVAVLPNLKEEKQKEESINRENLRLKEMLKQEKLKNEVFREHTYARLDAHDQTLGMDTRSIAGSTSADQASLLEHNSQINHSAIESTSSTPVQQPQTKIDEAWYYKSDDGKIFGPITRPELLQLYKRNKIKPKTLVWSKQYMDGWKEIDQIQDSLKDHS